MGLSYATKGGTYALEIESVSRSFGGVAALDGVSLTLERGERRAVIGPNGAGKTTLFRVISGEDRQDTGQIRLFARDISNAPSHHRRRMGIGRTYQITNVFPDLTVGMGLFLAVQGLSRAKFAAFRSLKAYPTFLVEANHIAESVGLDGHVDQKSRELSYGQQRQLEIGLALAGKPAVLLLDEPGAGLSVSERATMADVIRSLPEDVTIALIEHDMELALGLSEQVACLYSGQVVADCSCSEIRTNDYVQEIYLGGAG